MQDLLVWVLVAGLIWVAVTTRSRPRVLVILAAVAYLAVGQIATWNIWRNGQPASEAAIARSGQLIAYFTKGHGERDPDGADRLGYSTIASLLRQQTFTVLPLDFSQGSGVPPDASVVIVAGPKIDFLVPEIDALRDYAAAGGSVLLLLDPVADLKRYVTESGAALFMIDPEKKSDNPELTRVEELLGEWGVELGRDIVVDLSGMGEFLGTDASVPVAAGYPDHAITANFSILTAYPVARSITPLGQGTRHMVVQPLVETSERSWAETDVTQLTSSGKISMDQARGDRQGPITLAVAISGRPDPARRESRLVVIGDSDFVANYVGNIPGNVDFFLRSVSWLARRESTPAQ